MRNYKTSYCADLEVYIGAGEGGRGLGFEVGVVVVIIVKKELLVPVLVRQALELLEIGHKLGIHLRYFEAGSPRISSYNCDHTYKVTKFFGNETVNNTTYPVSYRQINIL